MAVNNSAVNNRDAQIFDANPTFNYGVFDGLNIRKTNTATVLRSLLDFTLPSDPGNTNILKITLVLTKQTTLGATGNVEVHALTRSFVEGSGSGSATGDGATWNTYNGSNNWTSAGGDFSGTIINTVADPPNVGDLLSIDLFGGNATNSMNITWNSDVNLILKQQTETGTGTDVGGIYYSKEDSTSSNRPYIVITYYNGGSVLLNMI